MSHLFNAAIIFGLLLFVSTTQATYNLYLNEYETMRLLGELIVIKFYDGNMRKPEKATNNILFYLSLLP